MRKIMRTKYVEINKRLLPVVKEGETKYVVEGSNGALITVDKHKVKVVDKTVKQTDN